MHQILNIVAGAVNMPAVMKSSVSVAGAMVAAFTAPVMPYGALCTAMVFADFVSAALLSRRLRRKFGREAVAGLSSRRFRSVLATLAKVYALLLLAHGVDVVIVDGSMPVCVLRFAAALVCFWQFWSILENESSANDAPWAKIAQRILVDKSERHLGIDLSDLKSRTTGPKNKED